MVQRAIESRGIPTVSPSVALDVTLQIKPPRSMFLKFMMGHLFGVPHHEGLQREIILKLLEHLQTATEDRRIIQFQTTWAEARKQGKALEKVRKQQSD